MRRLMLAGAIVGVLSGCATEYGDMGYLGGVTADQMTATRWRISARGNSYTSGNRISDYALRKAAETTLAQGYVWFYVLNQQDKSSVGQTVSTTPTQTYGTASAMGNTATFNATTYGGQTSIETYVMPGEDMMIELGNGPRPQGAMDAAETLIYVTPRTGNPNNSGAVVLRAIVGG